MMMLTKRCWLFALTLGVASPACAQQLSAEKLGGIRERMQQFVDHKDIAGAVTLVGRSTGIAYIDTVGFQDLEAARPMEPGTVFRIASMTKPITALGIMILVDEGKLKVGDPVERYLPEFRGQMMIASRSGNVLTLKKPSRQIQIFDLLTHTSGMSSMPPPSLGELYTTRDRSLAEAVLAYSQRPLEFEPGSKWSYCNTGIDTLGRIIEVVSKRPYELFLKERIFDPLAMRDTTFYPSSDQLQRTARTYQRKDGELRANPGLLLGSPVHARYPIPAGGLYSTAGDLARLYQMMLHRGATGNRRIVSEASVQAMTQVQTRDLQTGFSDGMSFGLGWGVVRKPVGVTEALSPGSYGHGGAFGTQAWIDPHKDLFVILLIQRGDLPNSDASEMRRELLSAAL
jgi:CubicO group peptidase (beta-lactamase class C family)